MDKYTVATLILVTIGTIAFFIICFFINLWVFQLKVDIVANTLENVDSAQAVLMIDNMEPNN